MSTPDNRQQIRQYIMANGPTTAADLEKALNLTKGKVWHALKHKQFKQGGDYDSRWQNAELPKVEHQHHEWCLSQIRSQIASLKTQAETLNQQLEQLRVVEQYHVEELKNG